MCCRFSHRMWTVYFHLNFCWWIFVLKCSDSGQSVSWWVSPFECCTESADGDFYSKLNNQLTMLARSLAEGKLFSCHSERRHCKRQNLCEEMKIREEVQVDWPWANDAFIGEGKTTSTADHSSTSYLFLSILPVGLSLSLFPFLVKAMRQKWIFEKYCCEPGPHC